MRNPPHHLVIGSNLHVGGGVQVAASFIDEVAKLAAAGDYPVAASSIQFEVSSEVARNLQPETLDVLMIEVVDRRPSAVGRALRDRLTKHWSVFTIFGPLYSFPRAHQRLMGYADVTSLYPPALPRAESALQRGRRAVRSAISRFEVSCADVLVVETDAMRARVIEVLGAKAPRVEVVANAVNARVFEAELDVSITDRLVAERAGGSEVLLAYPTRAYPHKNLELLPLVRRSLALHGVAAKFVVTLRSDEWADRTAGFREACVNLGEVSIDQVATVMRASDGVFFPSLLEAYSATPIEAMALGVPLYASNRDFVRTCCGAIPYYFDPNNADSAASAVLAGRREPEGERAERLREGRARVAALPTSTDRARAYLDLMVLHAKVAS